jgi:outer membrane protein assembly factor BamB
LARVTSRNRRLPGDHARLRLPTSLVDSGSHSRRSVEFPRQFHDDAERLLLPPLVEPRTMLATHLTHLRVPVWSAVLIVSVACSPVAWGDEVWPGFNGPRHNNQSDCRGLPLTWNETDNITWKTPIHDSGWSTPVIWGNQVWVTTATDDGKQSFALCLDRATGKVLHDLKLWDNAEPENTRQYNSFASSTPAIEEGRIYVHFGSYGTACLDTATAQVLWTRRDLPCQHFRGPGSSPLLAGDRLYIHYDGFDQQYIVALDKHTGKTVWQKKREVDYGTDNGDVKKAYATPLLFESQGRKMLASPTSKACLVLDPETGAELWRVRYAGFSGAARPLWGDGLLYLNTGFPRGEFLAVNPDGRGDVTESHIAWQAKKNLPSMPSSILVNGLLFSVNDEGVATCLDARSGSYVWEKRIGGNFSASLLLADGRIYASDYKGKTTVFAPEREFRLLAENQLEGGFRASPAVAGKALFLRTETHLYRIEQR